MPFDATPVEATLAVSTGRAVLGSDLFRRDRRLDDEAAVDDGTSAASAALPVVAPSRDKSEGLDDASARLPFGAACVVSGGATSDAGSFVLPSNSLPFCDTSADEAGGPRSSSPFRDIWSGFA